MFTCQLKISLSVLVPCCWWRDRGACSCLCLRPGEVWGDPKDSLLPQVSTTGWRFCGFGTSWSCQDVCTAGNCVLLPVATGHTLTCQLWSGHAWFSLLCFVCQKWGEEQGRVLSPPPLPSRLVGPFLMFFPSFPCCWTPLCLSLDPPPLRCPWQGWGAGLCPGVGQPEPAVSGGAVPACPQHSWCLSTDTQCRHWW